MLIYSKEPLNIMMKNILLLDDPFTGGYVYVNKETFEQALSLKITFNEDINRVKGTISGKGMLNWAANKVVSNVVSLCSEHFCSPLNMLAPYLAYTLPIGVEWPEDHEEIVKMAYGVLHQMSQFLNFYGTALMPSGAKADITIPKNIIMSYEDSWKAQLETLDKCVVTLPIYVSAPAEAVVEQQPVVQPVVAAQPAKVTSSNEEDSDDITVPVRSVSNDEKDEDNDDVHAEEKENNSGEAEAVKEEVSEVSEEETNDQEEESGEEDEESPEAMEARILAMMKAIEDAPAEEFTPNEEPKADAPATEEKKEKKESVNYGESGSINITEREIAEGNRQLLSDYDF